MKNLGNVITAAIGLAGITIAVSCMIKMKSNETKEQTKDIKESCDIFDKKNKEMSSNLDELIKAKNEELKVKMEGWGERINESINGKTKEDII